MKHIPMCMFSFFPGARGGGRGGGGLNRISAAHIQTLYLVWFTEGTSARVFSESVLSNVVWLVSAPFSMFVHQKVVRIPHNNAEAKKKGISWPLICSQ
jgi:hypothetical protein